jgi:hypothetical protein
MVGSLNIAVCFARGGVLAAGDGDKAYHQQNCFNTSTGFPSASRMVISSGI